MLKRLLLLICCLFTLTLPAYSQGVGIFVRNGTSGVSSPVANQTLVLDISQTPAAWMLWNGSAWQQVSPPQFSYAETTNPSTSNDQTEGYAVGSLWFNTDTSIMWICTSAATGNAVWSQLSGNVTPVNNQAKFTTADWMGDFVASGLLGSVPVSSLTMSTPGGVAYVGGIRITPTNSTYTYTASYDTYDYLQSNGTINHPAVPNGNPAPSGQTGLFIQKVVANGSEITSVTQTAAIAPLVALRASTSQLQSNNGNYINAAVANGLSGNWIYTNPDLGANAYYVLATAASGSSGLPFLGGGTGPGSYGVLTYLGGGTGINTAPSNGQLFIGNSGSWALNTLTAGSGISITNAGGSITIGNTFSSLTSGYIYVGNGSNVATGVAMSGDVTISNTGATTISTVNSDVGSYTNANITVNEKGQITAASNGSGGSGSVGSGTANQVAYYASSGSTVGGGNPSSIFFGDTSNANPLPTSGTIAGGVYRTSGNWTQTGAITFSSSPVILYFGGTVSFTGTVTIPAGYEANQGGYANPGQGLGGGGGSNGSGAQGSGGSHGGVGGNANGGYANLGQTYPYTTLLAGSGGGGGNATIGGDGGGSCYIEALGAISVGGSCTISANGVAGSNSGYTSGGGSGGGFDIRTPSTITIASGGIIEALGGNGGSGGGNNSGAGGGGVINLVAGGGVTNNGTLDVNGGTCSGDAGLDGGVGVVTTSSTFTGSRLTL